MTDRTLIYPGSEVKALGSGRVAGYLVRFGGPESADVQGDFFTAQTYFGRAVKAGTDIVWHHGIGNDGPGQMLRNSIIGESVLTMRPDGLWAEGTLKLDMKGVTEIYQDVEAGKVGWSSGSVQRLVQREPVAGKTAVKAWPIIEASLSYKPVDPRNKAVAIKALIDTPAGEGATPTLVETSERLVADATELRGLYARAAEQRQAEGRNLSEPKRAAIRELAEAFTGLYDATQPRPDPERVAAVRRRLIAGRI
jgi:hypothetical protein